MNKLICTFAAVATMFQASAAIIIAQDDASDAAYSGGFSNGTNGGVGFQAWQNIGNAVDPTGFGGGFIGNDTNFGLDITTGPDNEAWGIYGNNGGVGEAVRPFSTALAIGQTFSIQMDNKNIDNGGTVGFGLRDSSGNARFEFFFVGGGTNYTIDDAFGSMDTGIGWTTSGLDIAFTLTGTDSYSVTINGGTPFVSSLKGTSGAGIEQARLFNANGGDDVGFNSIKIVDVVPEPAASALLAFGLLALRLMRRR